MFIDILLPIVYKNNLIMDSMQALQNKLNCWASPALPPPTPLSPHPKKPSTVKGFVHCQDSGHDIIVSHFGANMAGSARIVLRFISIYVFHYAWFGSKLPTPKWLKLRSGKPEYQDRRSVTFNEYFWVFCWISAWFLTVATYWEWVW